MQEKDNSSNYSDFGRYTGKGGNASIPLSGLLLSLINSIKDTHDKGGTPFERESGTLSGLNRWVASGGTDQSGFVPKADQQPADRFADSYTDRQGNRKNVNVLTYRDGTIRLFDENGKKLDADQTNYALTKGGAYKWMRGTFEGEAEEQRKIALAELAGKTQRALPQLNSYLDLTEETKREAGKISTENGQKIWKEVHAADVEKTRSTKTLDTLKEVYDRTSRGGEISQSDIDTVNANAGPNAANLGYQGADKNSVQFRDQFINDVKRLIKTQESRVDELTKTRSTRIEEAKASLPPTEFAAINNLSHLQNQLNDKRFEDARNLIGGISIDDNSWVSPTSIVNSADRVIRNYDHTSSDNPFFAEKLKSGEFKRTNKLPAEPAKTTVPNAPTAPNAPTVPNASAAGTTPVNPNSFKNYARQAIGVAPTGLDQANHAPSPVPPNLSHTSTNNPEDLQNVVARERNKNITAAPVNSPVNPRAKKAVKQQPTSLKDRLNNIRQQRQQQ